MEAKGVQQEPQLWGELPPKPANRSGNTLVAGRTTPVVLARNADEPDGIPWRTTPIRRWWREAPCLVHDSC